MNKAQVVAIILFTLLPVGMMGLLMWVDGFRPIRLTGLVCSLTVAIVAILTVT
jgi:hypothetical protein